MNATLETNRLRLVLPTLAEARAQIDAAPPEHKAQMSADWLARFHALTESDPWIVSFKIILRDGNSNIGGIGFKGPPSSEGIVEISYGIEPEYQGRGFATEAAQALTDYAFRSGRVRTVIAHTLPEPNASTRVLTKCGYRFVGEVIDPDDGPVWRWEKTSVPEIPEPDPPSARPSNS